MFNEIDNIAQDVDNKTLSLCYLKVLKVLGKGTAIKFVIAAGLMNLGHTC